MMCYVMIHDALQVLVAANFKHFCFFVCHLFSNLSIEGMYGLDHWMIIELKNEIIKEILNKIILSLSYDNLENKVY